jgi:elongation factor 1 alpha-like protein
MMIIPSQSPSVGTSRAASPMPLQAKHKAPKGHSTDNGIDQQRFDMASLNLQDDAHDLEYGEPPKISLAREKVLEQARAALVGDNQGRKGLSLVVIGMQVHVNKDILIIGSNPI